MRNALVPLGAAVLLFLSLFTVPLVGQAPNGVGNGGETRPRQSGQPAPRSADGRALLGTTAQEKGVEASQGGVPVDAIRLPDRSRGGL